MLDAALEMPAGFRGAKVKSVEYAGLRLALVQQTKDSKNTRRYHDEDQ